MKTLATFLVLAMLTTTGTAQAQALPQSQARAQPQARAQSRAQTATGPNLFREIEARHQRGELDLNRYHLYRVAAVKRPDRLPPDLRPLAGGPIPVSATSVLVEAMQHVIRTGQFGGPIQELLLPRDDFDYYIDYSYYDLAKKAFLTGLWHPYTVYLTGGSLSLRHFVPMVFVSGLIVLAVGSFILPFAKYLLLLYLAAYVIPAGAFSVACARREKGNALFVFAAFLLYHISYGLGSLCGLLTLPFRLRKWKKS